MQWERRTPLWPKVAGLGLLLALVLAAPYAWQTGNETFQAEETAQLAPQLLDSAPAEPEFELPVAVAEQLTAAESNATDFIAAEPSAIEPIATNSTEHMTVPRLVAPKLVVPPSPVVKAPPQLDLTTLGQIYERLLTLIDQLPEPPTAPQLATPQPVLAAPRPVPAVAPVRVASEGDRLAMLPPRAHKPKPSITEPSTARPLDAEIRTAQTPTPVTRSRNNRSHSILLRTPEPIRASPIEEQPTPATNQGPSLSQQYVPRIARVPDLVQFPTDEPDAADEAEQLADSDELGGAENDDEDFDAELDIDAPTPAQPPTLAVQAAPNASTQATQARPTPAPTAPTPTAQVPTPAQPIQTPAPAVEPPALRHPPLALIDQLKNQSPRSPSAVWNQRVLAAIDHLTTPGPSQRAVSREALVELERLHAAAIQQLQQSETTYYHSQFQQSVQSLGRRLVLWRLLLDPEQPRIVQAAPVTTDMWSVLEGVSQLVGNGSDISGSDDNESGNDWRNYLMLDRIAELTSEGIESPTLARAKLAQQVLARMNDPELTEAQIEFLNTEPLAALQSALRPWAAGMVNLETLAALIERYESGGQNLYAEAIAQLQQRLQWSDDERMQTLADQLDQHFRGANMRIAMSDVLMNRMLPAQQPIVSPVNDRVAGARVFGNARTTTELRVRLQPDPEAWHVRLEANGKVYSRTRSDTWPARIRNAARMQYQGHKDISISEQGVKMAPAQATAQARNELVGVDSEFDPIPIVGHLLRDMARNKHKKNRPQANSQAKSKVVRQVKERMDSGLAEKLEKFEQAFHDKVLGPIEELALLAEPLDMHTTEKRAVMQLRLANTGQLAAHTLRPNAPSDSVLSVQMHETALNNAMMGLGLDGKRMTMLELFNYLTQRFGQMEATPPEEMPHRARIQFSKHDAARIRCDGDRLELILSVAELSHRRDKIKNFEIHVHFRPVLSGLSVQLVRDGALQFSGRRLKTGPRVVLHSVLGKVLPEEQRYTLISPKLMLDSRFQGLTVTQLVLDHGWLGLAIGPAGNQRTAERAPTPEVLSTPFVR